MKHIVIIGGGASGMSAAIAAARKGALVTLLEQNDITGKKILSTGNGRCNLTNTRMGTEYYRSDELTLLQEALEQVPVSKVRTFLDSIGIFTKSRGGYIYPRSDQAASVRQAFAGELKRLGVKVITGTKASEIRRKKGKFVVCVEDSDLRYEADKVILSCGSKASMISGSDGSGYEIAKRLGHHISPVVPALVQLRSKEKVFAKLAGVRTDATVSLYIDDTFVTKDTGELQLTKYGISGIPVFQISRYASKALYAEKKVPKKIEVRIDFLPDMSENEFSKHLLKRVHLSEKQMAEELLNTIFPEKLITVLLNQAEINKTVWAEKIADNKWENLAHICKQYSVIISDTNDFEQAQICAGGVCTTEIDPKSMESMCVPGIYVTGELLDVDGICGGYNLHFAWVSGMLAGEHAAR